jgi:hypothetical protein
MKTAICTLFEGDYHYGVGALVNSLHDAGFAGTLYAGHRGPLPPWAVVDSNSTMAVSEALKIQFVSLSTPWHLTNYKPTFLREIWAAHGHDWEALYYFDPDIVVRARWEEFTFWAGCGIAVVEDVMNGRIGSTHPLRVRWQLFAATLGLKPSRTLESFYNGGFVGIHARQRDFVNLWERLMAALIAEGAFDPREFMCGGKKSRAYAFYGTDQDTLNLALMLHPGPVSCVGPEGMDFQHSGYFMSHAIASPKPWRSGALWAALGGRGPTVAIREFWKYVERPIPLYSPLYLRLRRAEVLLAAFVSRFIRKP